MKYSYLTAKQQAVWIADGMPQMISKTGYPTKYAVDAGRIAIRAPKKFSAARGDLMVIAVYPGGY